MNSGFAAIGFVMLVAFGGSDAHDHQEGQVLIQRSPDVRLEEEAAAHEISLSKGAKPGWKPAVRATPWRVVVGSGEPSVGVRLSFGYQTEHDFYSDSWTGAPVLSNDGSQFQTVVSLRLTSEEFGDFVQSFRRLKDARFMTSGEVIATRSLVARFRQVNISRHADGWSMWAGDKDLRTVNPEIFEGLLTHAAQSMEALRAAPVSVEWK